MEEKSFNIHHISDTHGFHTQLKIPDNVDILIHSGDSTNQKNPFLNWNEFINFVKWYSSIPVKYKILISGNHDSSLESLKKDAKELLKDNGIIYLEDELIKIKEIMIYGTPWTPTFEDWCFMKNRDKMYKVWEKVPLDTNILISHGPPKGILDLTENRDYTLEQVGDKAILKYLEKWKDLKYVLFGHIHNRGNITNTGIRELDGIKFINSSGVEDGRFDKGIIYNGTTFNFKI